MAGRNIAKKSEGRIKEPKGNSLRISYLRDFYFSGLDRKWNNEFTCWGLGTEWDVIYDEIYFYIVPETYPFLQTFRSGYRQAARTVPIPDGFWDKSIAERRAIFNREVILNHLPQEILPGDLIAGARFNLQTSRCFTEAEAAERDGMVLGKKGARKQIKWFHNHGYGNAGATAGHLVPGHERALTLGWAGISKELDDLYDALSDKDKTGPKGAQLKAMKIAAQVPAELAARYAEACRNAAAAETNKTRRAELEQMAANLEVVPEKPPETFWQAVQALWLNHMLIMADENYPGPGVSFGRIDQYLYPYWEKSRAEGMSADEGKEILKCFWIHCNTAYDAMIRVGGNQGITAGFGQLITLSGLGAGGADMTNDLTYAILDVIDDLSPILEPKPNVRLHRNSPEKLLDRVVEMVGESQGAPFLLNFDERSMAGMLREAKLAGLEKYINEDNVHEYAPVGCLENTMVGNDRSGTVDINLNLYKAVELALTGGRDMHRFVDPFTGKKDKLGQDGPETGPAVHFTAFSQFWEAYAEQTRYIIRRAVETYELSESVRARFSPTPYLSCLVKGCAESGRDITAGGAEISLVTIEAVTFATTVDSLLAIKYLVFDKKLCTMAELMEALLDNWEGHDKLAAFAKNRPPKYGRDDDEADGMADRVMDLWTEATWKQKTKSTDRKMRPGMLSWNYWISDGFILPASPNGRPRGQFLSNAICPSNGADINGPTANANSVGKALGGKSKNGDWNEYVNKLPNGASHTITFNPSILRDGEHRDKFKAFLRGYAENGGTALQINMLDPDMLREAQRRPRDYRHLLVRVTGYNAYFSSIGRELQDEVIARVSHEGF